MIPRAIPPLPADDSLRALGSWLHYCVLAGIVGIGSYLRLTLLGWQSLWFDEADIVVRAQRSWSDVFSTFTIQGENGPLYNVLLAAWVRVAGSSEAAVRFPSAVAGILALPAIYLLARRLAGPQAGLIATGLLAVSPYHIWYSQEAKMYSIVVLFAILSTLLLKDALTSGGSWRWIGYVFATTLMFYTHVVTVLIFGVHVLFVLATYGRWKSQAKAVLLAGAALTLPYLPIAIWALRVVGGDVPTWHSEFSFLEAMKDVGIRFATFRSDPEVEFRAAWLYFLIAAGAALWLIVDRRRRRTGLLLVGLATAPVIGLWVVSLRNSVFSDRYTIGALPAYLILVAIGLAYLGRNRLGIIPAVLLATALVAYTWVPVSNVNRSDIAQKEDWRGAYERVADRAEPDEVFVMHPGYMISTLAYYGQRNDRLGGHPVGTIPSFAPDWMTRDVMIDMLRDDFGRFTRFWLIESPDRVPFEDPNHELSTWLSETGVILYQDQVNGVRVTLYELPPGW